MSLMLRCAVPLYPICAHFVQSRVALTPGEQGGARGGVGGGDKKKKRFFICGKKCKTVHSMGHSAYATLIGGLVESKWLKVELVYIVSTI